MRKILNLKIISLVFIFLLGIGMSFSDPGQPPPPPVVNDVFYYDTEYIMDCSPSSVTSITYCENYKIKRTIKSQGGAVISDVQENVCGEANNEWITKTVSSDWVCPEGYVVASQHTPGHLDPEFDTISISRSLPHFSEQDVDLYFNAYVPACVNRIPMINLEPKLIDEDGNKLESKVGLYVKHESVHYDASPTGGVLEDFSFNDDQESFVQTYTIDTNMKAYRFWSFRRTFVQSLERIVDKNNLELPENINLNTLSSTSTHSIGDLYLSRDFMLGAEDVSGELTGNPIGESITVDIDGTCIFDVNELSISQIQDSSDFASRHNSKKSQIIAKLQSDSSICGIDSNTVIRDFTYVGDYPSTDYETRYKTLNLDITDYNFLDGGSQIRSVKDFEDAMSDDSNYPGFSNQLQSDGKLSSPNPLEDISDIIDIDYTLQTITLTLEADDLFSGDDSDDLKDWLLASSTNQVYSKLVAENELQDYQYIANSINSGDISIIDSDYLDLELRVYPKDFEIDVEIAESFPYYGFVEVDLEMTLETSTEHSWSWRELESLDLTTLGKCLYNWDDCFYNPRNEYGTSWEMNEVADLGYGPRLNTLHWQGSIQNVINEGLDASIFSKYFDGARGEQNVVVPLTTYRDCDAGEYWQDPNGIYLCYDNTVYKCHYAISAEMNVESLTYPFSHRSIAVGGIVRTDTSEGYVCANTADGYQWRKISC